jgi:hypothetical protein
MISAKTISLARELILFIFATHPTQYDEIISWSSLYDSASIEAKKMIVNSMIKRVDVYRNYDLIIELNMNIRQSSLAWRNKRAIRSQQNIKTACPL